jgi:amino acid adenylation domain-containing protein
MRRLLREDLAHLLRLPASAIAADRPLLAFGLDSLAAVELCVLVEERFGSRPSLEDLLLGATLDELVAAAAADAAGAPQARAPQARAPQAAATAEQPAELASSGGDEAPAEIPLSAGQRALWLAERLAPGSGAYNLAGAARVHGDLDAEALRRACLALACRHPALRTSFAARGGEPHGRLREDAEIDFAVAPAAAAQAELAAALRDEAVRPFDLERGPLLRVRVWPLAGSGALLLLAIHHLAADFWSLSILLQELGVFYRQEAGGAPAAMAPPPIAPGEAVRRQSRRLAGPHGEELWSYWRQALAGELPPLDLATDRPRPPVQTYAGGSRPLRLDAGLAGRVRRLAGAGGATLHTTLLAVFQALLYRYGGPSRVLVGCPTAGRGSRDLDRVVGYFVNPVVVAAELTPQTTASALLGQVRDRALGAIAHAEFPFPLLVARLQPERDASRSPLFQAMFALQGAPRPAAAGLAAFALGEAGAQIELGGLVLDSLALPERRVPCELTLMMAAAGDGLAASLQFNADLFDGATAERMLAHLARLADGMTAAPEAPLADLDLLSAAERLQLTAASRAAVPAAGTAGEADTCLHRLIAAQAALTPGATALVCGERRLTYREVWLLAGRLASRLRRLGVRPEVRVGLFAGRTPEMVAGMLAVLRAGGAYVPLDPAYPAERLAWLLADARPAVVLAERALTSRLPRSGVPVVPLDEESAVAEPPPVGASGDENLLAATGPGEALPANLAYLIYTSGSTGRPKAVALAHRGAVALARWAREAFTAEELAGVLASTSFTFDLSIFELLVPLCWGGRVILAGNVLELSRLGLELDVRLVNTVPSALAEALRRRPLPSSVRTVNLAGEPLPRQLVADLFAGGSVRRVLNLYGPSEDTTYSTAALQHPDDPGAPHIGGPIAGGRAYLLAPGGTRPAQVPLGVRGEIYLGGPGLARGYFGRPELTAERFVPSPFAGGEDAPGARLYRTGDLARRLPDGSLEFLGRIDHQVKVRGFRIEPGEVEAALRELPEVGEAAVLAVAGAPDSPGLPWLAGFVVAHAAGTALAAEPLRAALRRRLPEAMVPAVLLALPALPLTPHGKLDRGALVRLALAARADRRAAAPWREPATPEEILVAACFAAVLGVSPVGADDDFFALGGHSLLASRVQARIGEQLGVELPLAAFFQAPTAATLARYLGGPAAAPRLPPPERLPRDGGDLPLSFAQERLWFLARLHPESAAYNMVAGVQLSGPLDVAALRLALAEICRRHEALSAAFPEVAGRPVQRPGGRLPAPSLLNLEGLPAAARQLAAAAVGRREACRPFSLEHAAPCRLRLLRLSATRHLLLVILHHIAADEASLEVLIDELGALYPAFAARRPSPLAAAPLAMADFAAWQRRTLTAEVLAPRLEWWQERLRDLPVLELGTGPQRGTHGHGHGRPGRRVEREVPAATVSALAALGRGEGATLFVTLLAAFQAWLARLTGEADVPVGCPVSLRDRPELATAVGLYVDTLVLRGDVGAKGAKGGKSGEGGDPSVRELIGRSRAALAAARQHEVPFELLVRRLRPERHPGRNPLFDAAFALHRPPRPRRLPELTLEPLAIPTGTAKFDLTLFALDTERGLTLVLEAAADRFDAPAALRLASQLATLLAAAAVEPDRPAVDLPLLGAAERHQLIHEWGAGPAGPPPTPAVHLLVQDLADRLPHLLAVESAAGTLTYGELDRRARALARALRRRGVGAEAEEVVAIALPRSAESVAAALAVLLAGGAWLPLDPSHPVERLAAALEDSRARVLLTEASLAAALAAERTPGLARLAVVVLDSWAAWDAVAGEMAGPGASAAAPGFAPGAAVHRDPSRAGLAYVIYTSGSTGAPKGVALTHGGLANLVSWHLASFRVVAADRAALVAGPGFDAAVWEVWPYLVAGASLHVPDPAAAASPASLLAWLAARRITIAFLPTPMAEAVLALPRPAGLALRTLLTGGDRLHLRPAPGSGWNLVNQYGPTEGTVVATWAPVPEAAAEPGPPLLATAAEPGPPLQATAVELGLPPPPIGRPIDAVTATVTGADGEPQPPGVPGELRLGGSGLARGYLRRPDLTAERFVPDPLAARRGEPGARAYRTGDRARWRTDGQLEFLGRLDRQVKVRGFRLEPAEVEAALAAHPEVREAAVAVHGGPDSVRLTAYVVARASGQAAPADASGPDAATLRDWLRRKLPEPMIPTAFVMLAALPLTRSGKIDRRALRDPGPPRATGPGDGPRAPRTPAERLVAAAWAAALAVDATAVALDDDFFAAGGHSLLAPRLAALLRQASGVDLPLRIVFERPTVAGLAAALDEARVQARGAGWLGGPPPIERVARQPPPPLSLAQERLWFLDQLEPGSPVYNLPAPLLLAGDLDARALRRAFTRVVARHEALRTTFTIEAGRPVQCVQPASSLPLPRVDLAALPEPLRQPEAIRLARLRALRPFDLRRAPLLRTALLRLEPRRHVLLLEAHHIAADGRSFGILLGELAVLYGAALGADPGSGAGPPVLLAALPVQYADYAVWQRRCLEQDAASLAAALEWWRLRLAGAPAVLPLPFDRPRPAMPSCRGGSHRLELSAAETGALRELGRTHGASLFMVLLAVLTALLRRLTGQGDLVVGTPVANRPRPELEPLIGFFVNNLVLRLDAAGDPPFADCLAGVREAALAAFLREVPFEKLVEALSPDRDLGHNPFYQVVFALEGAERPALALPGLRLAPLPAGSGTAKFDLAVYVEERPDGLAVLLEVRRDLFDAPTAIRLLEQFAALARQAPRDPRRRLFELPLLDAAARHQALREANDTAVAPPAVPFVHRWIAARAAAAPGAPAVTGGGRTLSYGELDRRANQLAHRLRALGAGPESRVAVALERSPELIIAMLAIWKAGAAYVPLDTDYPGDRLAAMLDDCRAAALLRGPRATLDLPPALPTLELDGSWSCLLGEPDHDPEVDVPAESLAYVIYTSGSTGRPKGVMIQHGSLASYAVTATRSYGVVPEDRVLQFCSVSFDISIEEIVPCLTVGAELVLRTDAMLASVAVFLDTCRAWALSVMSLPTAYWHDIAAAIEAEALPLPSSLRLVIIAGERALPERLLAWRRAAPRRPRLINTYGLTESTIISTVGDLTACAADGHREVPIGRVIADTEIYVLDSAGEPVPPGVPGELYIGGGLLARGYHALPAVTAERFVPHPFPPRPGERLYRTGDLARLAAGGELELLGRDDHQVKIRGYRIEIGEIEAALARHADLQAVAVAAPEELPGQQRLVAYVVAGRRRPATDELRSFLAETLPGYMVPAQFLFLDALPLTPNGKLDRRALPAPPPRAAGRGGARTPLPDDTWAPPRDDTERALTEIWRQALGVERVSIRDNFFDLGGHSLLLIRVHAAVQERFGTALPMVELFKHPTIESLARRLGGLAERGVADRRGAPAGGAGLGEGPSSGLGPPPGRVQERAARTRAAVGQERFRAARRRLRRDGLALADLADPAEPADGER